jgi:hypothetical protein
MLGFDDEQISSVEKAESGFQLTGRREPVYPSASFDAAAQRVAVISTLPVLDPERHAPDLGALGQATRPRVLLHKGHAPPLVLELRKVSPTTVLHGAFEVGTSGASNTTARPLVI